MNVEHENHKSSKRARAIKLHNYDLNCVILEYEYEVFSFDHQL